MESYGKILLVAMPTFLLLVLIEYWLGRRSGKRIMPSMDAVSSLSSGITNVIKDVLGLSVSILSYAWMVENLALVRIEQTVVTYVIAFVAIDFQGYWVHRLSHQINFFWNKHAIHHSSEEFNLACALRQSISSFVALFTFFLLPAALLGVPAMVIGVVAPLHLFAQFWYHTQLIGRMGWLEHLLVTPSHHRVHHAINPEYIDRNHSQIFIGWDKLFGTFQAELADVPPVYGMTRPANTYNPVKINFQHLALLVRDAWHTASWRDRWRIWWMPTGWRPADVSVRFPVGKVRDVFALDKFAPSHTPALRAWTKFQFGVVVVLVLYFFGFIASFPLDQQLWYGLFITLHVYAYTDLMDGSRRAWWWEAGKNLLGLGFMAFQSGGWFGAEALVPVFPWILGCYFVVATMVVWGFCYAALEPVAAINLLFQTKRANEKID